MKVTLCKERLAINRRSFPLALQVDRTGFIPKETGSRRLLLLIIIRHFGGAAGTFCNSRVRDDLGMCELYAIKLTLPSSHVSSPRDTGRWLLRRVRVGFSGRPLPRSLFLFYTLRKLLLASILHVHSD